MKLKLKFTNLHLILFLLFVVFLSSYFSTAGTFTNLYAVEGLTNNTYVTGVSDSVLDKTENLTDVNSDTKTSQNTMELPMGIQRDMIPQGEEDLYILKSQVVPPVCPACPTVSACPRQEPPPPCPPCARCPEPSFECKKVPNYSSANTSKYVPRPVLADFSQFGM